VAGWIADASDAVVALALVIENEKVRGDNAPSRLLLKVYTAARSFT
jgi:hypothetical protein